jgi:hypothetical protein
MRRAARILAQSILGAALVGLWLFLGSMLVEPFDWFDASKSALAYFAFFEAGVLSRYAVGWLPARRPTRARS